MQADTAKRRNRDNEAAFVAAVGSALRRQSASVGKDAAPRVIVALSGGPDSTALLLALHEAAPESLVAAAHFHHGLRGADANADASYCAALCARLGVPCAIALGRVTPAGRSPQDAARRDRYAFLAETAAEYDAHLVGVAHTADDQAETVLARVLRGTSIDGLAGIPATREFQPGLFIVRPMLDRSRAEVESFCASHGIVPRQDPSNTGTKYVRSRLRQRMPAIAQEFNPRLGDALRRLGDQAAIDSDLLRSLADDLWGRVVVAAEPGASVSLSAAGLTNAHAALRRRVLLRALLSIYAGDDSVTALEAAATQAFVGKLERIASAGRGAVSLPGGQIRASASGESLTLARIVTVAGSPLPPYEADLPVPGSVTINVIGLTIEARHVSANDAPDISERPALTIRCVAASLSGETDGTIVVRSPRPGDRIAPFGMRGETKSVRDVCADAKLPVAERDRIPLVVRTGERETVLWIVGLMQAESTRVTATTQEVVRLTAKWDGNSPVETQA